MTRDVHRPALVALSALVVLFAAEARAQLPPPVSSAPPPPADAADEEALLNQGVALREKGDDNAALGVFRRAYDLHHGAHALAQVALAEQALGHWVDAEAHLADAVARTDDPWIARNRALLESALADIRGHLGALELSGGVPGAEVRVNGVSKGTFPLAGPLRVLAGSVALEVRAPGYLPVVRTVIVPAGGLARESVVLIAAAPASPLPTGAGAAPTGAAATTAVAAPAAVASTGWSGRKTAALALGIAAVGGAAVGATFLVLRNGHAADFNDAGCTTSDAVQPANCASFKSDVDSATTISTVGFIGAGVLAGAATYLFLSDHPSEPTSTAMAHASFGLRCVPSAGTVVCAGVF